MDRQNSVASSRREDRHLAGPASPTDAAHPVDRHVGQQIRIRRTQSNVSQSDLAKGIGVSFQQLRKYESGRNRVSASVLYEVAACLNASVACFFDGLPQPGDALGMQEDAVNDHHLAYISTVEGGALIEKLLRLPPRLRSQVVSLVNAMTDDKDEP